MSVGDYLPLKGKVTGAQDQVVILAGTAAKIIGIRKIIIGVSDATSVRLQDNGVVPKSLTPIFDLAANAILTMDYPRPSSAPKTNAGNGITITTSAGNVAFDIEYWLEP